MTNAPSSQWNLIALTLVHRQPKFGVVDFVFLFLVRTIRQKKRVPPNRYTNDNAITLFGMAYSWIGFEFWCHWFDKTSFFISSPPLIVVSVRRWLTGSIEWFQHHKLLSHNNWWIGNVERDWHSPGFCLIITLTSVWKLVISRFGALHQTSLKSFGKWCTVTVIYDAKWINWPSQLNRTFLIKLELDVYR